MHVSCLTSHWFRRTQTALESFVVHGFQIGFRDDHWVSKTFYRINFSPTTHFPKFVHLSRVAFTFQGVQILLCGLGFMLQSGLSCSCTELRLEIRRNRTRPKNASVKCTFLRCVSFSKPSNVRCKM